MDNRRHTDSWIRSTWSKSWRRTHKADGNVHGNAEECHGHELWAPNGPEKLGSSKDVLNGLWLAHRRSWAHSLLGPSLHPGHSFKHGRRGQLESLGDPQIILLPCHLCCDAMSYFSIHGVFSSESIRARWRKHQTIRSCSNTRSKGMSQQQQKGISSTIWLRKVALIGSHQRAVSSTTLEGGRRKWRIKEMREIVYVTIKFWNLLISYGEW